MHQANEAAGMTATSKRRFSSKSEWADDKAREFGILAAQCRQQLNGGDWRTARRIDTEAKVYEREADKFRRIAAACRRKEGRS